MRREIRRLPIVHQRAGTRTPIGFSYVLSYHTIFLVLIILWIHVSLCFVYSLWVHNQWARPHIDNYNTCSARYRCLLEYTHDLITQLNTTEKVCPMPDPRVEAMKSEALALRDRGDKYVRLMWLHVNPDPCHCHLKPLETLPIPWLTRLSAMLDSPSSDSIYAARCERRTDLPSWVHDRKWYRDSPPEVQACAIAADELYLLLRHTTYFI